MAGKLQRIREKLLSTEVGHYTHFVMEEYNFRQIAQVMGELHAGHQGYFTCKQINTAHLFIVRRDA